MDTLVNMASWVLTELIFESRSDRCRIAGHVVLQSHALLLGLTSMESLQAGQFDVSMLISMFDG